MDPTHTARGRKYIPVSTYERGKIKRFYLILFGGIAGEYYGKKIVPTETAIG